MELELKPEFTDEFYKSIATKSGWTSSEQRNVMWQKWLEKYPERFILAQDNCEHGFIVHPEYVINEKQCPNCGCFPANE